MPEPLAEIETVLEKTFFRFVWKHSKFEQITVLLLTVCSFPILYFTLELPKIIVNEALTNGKFPVDLLGMSLDQVEYLMLLSFGFLTLVVINGVFKMNINIRKGKLGERMLRRLRYELYTRILQFPPARFRRTSSGELIPMVTTEAEQLGGFIGDSIALPVFQGGTLLVYLVFIFLQDVLLGVAAIALYPFQGWLIRRLQTKVNQLGKDRVRTMRQVADRIDATVRGVEAIHANDTSLWHRADLADRLGTVLRIRIAIFNRKYLIKFTNNFINQLVPFFFYSIGGYLVIRGNLSFGALVAVLAAYKDLAVPWKELIKWYQMKEDMRIKYEQIVEQFESPDLLERGLLDAEAPADLRMVGELAFNTVGYAEDGGRKLLENVTVAIPLDRHTAVLGTGGSHEFAQLAARLARPTVGRITLGGQDFASLPESLVGRRIAYVGPSVCLAAGSIRDNLVYPVMHRPGRDPGAAAEAETVRRRADDQREAELAGNTTAPIAADWINYPLVGAEPGPKLEARLAAVIRLADLEDDVMHLGLSGRIDPGAEPDTALKILAARAMFRVEAADAALDPYLEFWDPDRFNRNATIAENLLFGSPVSPALTTAALFDTPAVRAAVAEAEAEGDLLRIGEEVTARIFGRADPLVPGDELVEQFVFLTDEDVQPYTATLTRCRNQGAATLGPEDQARLWRLALHAVPARLGLESLDAVAERRLLAARRAFLAGLPASDERGLELFDEDDFFPSSSVLDNILRGKLVHGVSQGRARVIAVLDQVIEQLGLADTIRRLGLAHDVGIGGSRLTVAQRQKIGLARAFLKRPDLLVLDQATAGLDAAEQRRLHAAIVEQCQGRGLIWVVHRPALARTLDCGVILADGTVADAGPIAELAARAAIFREPAEP